MRESMTGARLQWVDAGRGLAICLVALFHATQWLATTGLPLDAWADINTVVSSLRMPLFFALAGLFARPWFERSWSSLLRAKIMLFVWVLLIWSAIDMIVQVSGLHAAGQPINFRAVIRDLLLVPIDPLFELWFIWALALFFVVGKLCRGVPVLAQLICAGVISAAALTVWASTTTGITGALKYYFFFLAGVYLRQSLQRWASAPWWAHGGVFLAWAVLSVGLFVTETRQLPGIYFVNAVVGVLAGVGISVGLSRLAWLGRLGTQTLPIYLAHTPIVILLLIGLLMLPPVVAALSPVAWLVPPIAAMIAIALAIGLHRFAQKSALRFLYVPPTALSRIAGTTAR